MATQVANREDHPLVALSNQLATRAEQFRMVLPNHISPEKFQRTVMTAAQADPELLNADRQSFLLACMRCAQDGLLPDKREAALVIFKENKQVNGQWQTRLLVQYMPMVYGLRKKILQSGEITDIFTQVVYRQEIENGAFIYEEGTERMLRHKPILDPDFEPTDDDLVLAYSIATFKDGSKSFEVMRRSEIQKVQEKSQTGATRTKKGEPRTPSGPWVEWKSEQWRKTVMRRHSKSLPMSGDLLDIEARDDEMAARSTDMVLSSGQAAPAAIVAPIRSETLTSQATDTIDVQVKTDADGVIIDDKPPVEAKAKRQTKAEKAAAGDQKPADDDSDGRQEQSDASIRRAMADSLIERIGRAETVGAVRNLKATTPAEWPDDLAEEVATAASDREDAIRAAAAR